MFVDKKERTLMEVVEVHYNKMANIQERMKLDN